MLEQKDTKSITCTEATGPAVRPVMRLSHSLQQRNHMMSTAQDSVEHTRLGQPIIKLISDLTSTLVTFRIKDVQILLGIL